MKLTSQYNIKKNYRKPAIEEVELDVAISLNNPTPGEGEHPDLPDDFTSPQATKSPDYGSLNFKQAESPFGGKTPSY